MTIQYLAPQINHHLYEPANQLDGLERWKGPYFLQVLEVFTPAWFGGRCTHLWHCMVDGGQINEDDLSPRIFESNAIWKTTQAIGFSDFPNALRPIKIEQPEHDKVTLEIFCIPIDINTDMLLSNAWGIWNADKKHVEVVLNFSLQVFHRVKESCWREIERTMIQGNRNLF